MKKFLILLLCSCSVSIVIGQSDDEDYVGGTVINMNKKPNSYPLKNIVSFEPVFLLIKGAKFGYERFITGKNSVKVRLGYGALESPSFFYDGRDYSHFRTSISTRYYVNHKNEEEFNTYFGAFAMYKQTKLDLLDTQHGTSKVEHANAKGAGFGMLAGLLLSGRNSPVTFGASAGAAYLILFDKNEAEKVHQVFLHPFKNRLIFQFEFNVGFTF